MYVKLSYAQYQMLLHAGAQPPRPPADTRFLPSTETLVHDAIAETAGVSAGGGLGDTGARSMGSGSGGSAGGDSPAFADLTRRYAAMGEGHRGLAPRG